MSAPENSFALHSLAVRHTIVCADKETRSRTRSVLLGFEGGLAVFEDEMEPAHHGTTAVVADEPAEDCQARKPRRKSPRLGDKTMTMLLSTNMDQTPHNLETYVEHIQIVIRFILNVEVTSMPILNLQGSQCWSKFINFGDTKWKCDWIFT